MSSSSNNYGGGGGGGGGYRHDNYLIYDSRYCFCGEQAGRHKDCNIGEAH